MPITDENLIVLGFKRMQNNRFKAFTDEAKRLFNAGYEILHENNTYFINEIGTFNIIKLKYFEQIEHLKTK